MKYLLVAGARPNFMKIALVHRVFSSRRNGHWPGDLLLVHTGQHYSPNMSDDFFRDLGIPEPDINLSADDGGQPKVGGVSVPHHSSAHVDIGRSHINDKVMHFGTCLALSPLPVIGFRDRRRGLMAGLSTFLLGVLTEADRHFSPGRA